MSSRGTSKSKASAAVVRAPRLARSSGALPTQWPSLPVDHLHGHPSRWLNLQVHPDSMVRRVCEPAVD